MPWHGVPSPPGPAKPVPLSSACSCTGPPDGANLLSAARPPPASWHYATMANSPRGSLGGPECLSALSHRRVGIGLSHSTPQSYPCAPRLRVPVSPWILGAAMPARTELLCPQLPRPRSLHISRGYPMQLPTPTAGGEVGWKGRGRAGGRGVLRGHQRDILTPRNFGVHSSKLSLQSNPE